MVKTMDLPVGVRADYTTEYSEIIAETAHRVATPFAEAAKEEGLDSDAVYGAMQPMHREREVVVGEIDRIPFISSRIRTGTQGSGRANRGGLEWGALPPKSAEKGTIMTPKQYMARTGDEGGKGAFWVPPEFDDAITDEWIDKAMAVHALLHHINGYDNPTATDIKTNSRHMNGIVKALLPHMSPREAYSAVSGASKEYGGVPDFQMPTTGTGSSIVLKQYLHARQKHGESDDQIADKLRRGERLRILLQALGKAGGPFARNIPATTELAGVMEYGGALFDPHHPIDAEEAIRLAQLNGIAEGSESGSQMWLPPDVDTFWKQQADILVPAFDKNQVDARHIRNGSARITNEIANAAVTEAGHATAEELEHDVIDGILDNMGGTLGSSKRGRMLLFGTYRNMDELATSWNEDMHHIPQQIFEEMYRVRRERGTYVSLSKVICLSVAKAAVARRNAVKTGIVSMA